MLIFFEFIYFLLILLNESFDFIILFLLNFADAFSVNIPILFSRVILSNMPNILEITGRRRPLHSVPSIHNFIPSSRLVGYGDSRRFLRMTSFDNTSLFVLGVKVILPHWAFETPVTVT